MTTKAAAAAAATAATAAPKEQRAGVAVAVAVVVAGRVGSAISSIQCSHSDDHRCLIPCNRTKAISWHAYIGYTMLLPLP